MRALYSRPYLLTAEALAAHRPEVFFDTVGYAFGYPLARLAGAKVAAYVHYPTISTDMIARVGRYRRYIPVNTGVESAWSQLFLCCSLTSIQPQRAPHGEH